jgi:hypothetical protein
MTHSLNLVKAIPDSLVILSSHIRFPTGGSFTGHLDAPVVMNKTDVYYRGRRILDAVLADLRTKHGLAAADKVVLSGGSAGGLATVANCDYVAATVAKYNAPTKTWCIADAGFFLDLPNAIHVGKQVMRDRFFDVVDGMNSSGQLPPRCIAAASSAAIGGATDGASGGAPIGDPRACFFAQHALRYTKTPVFLLNSMYNFLTWEILTDDPCAPGYPAPPPAWRSCMPKMGLTPQSWKQCTDDQQATVEAFRAEFLKAAAPALGTAGTASPHGAFLNSCPQNHVQNGKWANLRVGNVTAMGAVSQWIGMGGAEGPVGQGVHVVDSVFPSSRSSC